MIYFFTLLTSLCVQFCAVTFPVNNSEINAFYSNLTDTLYNDIQNRGFSFDKKYCVVVGDVTQYNGGGYEVFVPLEVLNGSNSANSVTNRVVYSDDNIDLGVNLSGWIRFKYGSNLNFLFGGYNEGVSNFTGKVLDPTNRLSYATNGILYNDYYTFTYQDSDTFFFDTVPELSGHTQTGKNDKILDSLPFPNAPTVTGHSNVSTVDDTSTNNLLGNILNSLQVIGNSITSAGNNIISFLSDLYGNINDTINYVIEPLDHEEVIDIMKNSHYNGLFDDLKNVKDSFDNLSNSDHVILSFTLPAYLGGSTFSFDFAQYFNSSKHIWQPLLLTFLYASLVWGFYKGFANMVNGSSPFVSDVHYQFANDRLQREQASDNHTR